MRLLQAKPDGNFSLASFNNSSLIPKYTILSHTWEVDDEEITLQDIMSGDATITKKSGYRKIRFCCDQTRKDGFNYFWVDSCCIDQRSSAEVSRLVNSMFRLYRDASICYVYLADLSVLGGLQDAPSSSHSPLDQAKVDVVPQWHSVFRKSSISERMSWSENRSTTLEEDRAYCLLGIFDILMPLVYGEGEGKAFIRLQDEIDRRSDSRGFGQANWAQEERRCLQTLYSTDYQILKNRLPNRVSGTCQWFLEHDHFKQLQQSISGLLWLSTYAQSGKSVLAKSLVDIDLKNNLVCYFFNSDAPWQKSASNALSAILHQLFLQNPLLVHHALPDFAFEGKRLAELFHKLWNILLKASAGSDTIICVLDGLDECEQQGRNRLLRAIAQYHQEGKSSASESHLPKLKFLLTSRSDNQDSSIQKQLEVLLDVSPYMRIEDNAENAIGRDINTVIEDQISTLNLELFRHKVFDTIRGVEDPEDLEIIHWAITNGHSGLVRIRIETDNVLGINSNCDGSDRTPLSYAAEKGYTGVIEQLLETGRANLESTDNVGRTPLHYASMCDRDDVVRLLLKAEAKTNQVDRNGRTLLSLVAESGKAIMVRMLLDAKADIETQDRYGRAALFYAAQNNHDTVVEILLKSKTNVNLRDKEDQSPLSVAVKNGHAKVVEMLLGAKPDINLLDQSSETMLSRAAQNGDDAVVALLLKANPTVDSKDHKGRTPPILAAREGYDIVVSQLLATGLAGVDLKDVTGRTALSYAASQGHDGVVSQLLATGLADVNSRCTLHFGQRTPLSFAAEEGHCAVIEQLLAVENIVITGKSKFNMEVKPSRQERHHYRAPSVSWWETKTWEVHHPDHGLTALGYAQKREHRHIAQLILGHKIKESFFQLILRKIFGVEERLKSC
ncbi:hypothetical protein GJ744_003114 [Endocarpon pusillum]|uniref:Heterokaryon incompatibility domain-containing protein n=1 Tax=Endocarpon pusillum TaxID=364733 RepID=A0A8H7ARU2_9EURO|nr:hypothetical protein GJ744_003114 [Endocarpon pusillum]